MTAYSEDSNVVTYTHPEPSPVGGTGDIWKMVISDMKARREAGITKYNTVLRAFNGRNALIDAYQEALDLAVYLRQVIEEDRKIEENNPFR
jgi:hypothetical protein